VKNGPSLDVGLHLPRSDLRLHTTPANCLPAAAVAAASSRRAVVERRESSWRFAVQWAVMSFSRSLLMASAS